GISERPPFGLLLLRQLFFTLCGFAGLLLGRSLLGRFLFLGRLFRLGRFLGLGDRLLGRLFLLAYGLGLIFDLRKVYVLGRFFHFVFHVTLLCEKFAGGSV